MPNLKLIYFEGCPNARKAKAALEKAGCNFEEIDQGILPEDHPMKCYSSPTILAGDEIVVGAKTGSAGGCSLEVPTPAMIREKLKS